MILLMYVTQFDFQTAKVVLQRIIVYHVYIHLAHILFTSIKGLTLCKYLLNEKIIAFFKIKDKLSSAQIIGIKWCYSSRIN